MSIKPASARFLSILAAAAVLAVAGTVAAADKKYPPYPEVWGRVLAVPEAFASTTYVGIYANPDGDRLFVFAYHEPVASGERGESKWHSLAFMGGELKRISGEEANRLFHAKRETGLYAHVGDNKLTLRNGYVVQRGTREFGGKRCWSNYAHTIEIRDEEDNLLVSKMLFRWYPSPQRLEVWEYCAHADGVDHFTAYAHDELPIFVPLEDGTFLAHTSHDKFVVRFKPDLTSPFIDNKRLFLVDTVEIDRVVEEAVRRPGPAIQNANDAIRDYLLTLRQESE